MSRLNKERQLNLEPKRLKTAKNKIESLGFEIIEQNDTALYFMLGNNKVQYHAYSGWYSGKGIGSGRGLENLIKKLNYVNG